MAANGLASATRPILVLDTNVVLDWLLFADPGVAPLAAALAAGSVRWVACPPMRNEFERALGYRTLAKWRPDRERLMSCFDRHAVIQATPPTVRALRCRDPDDQIFLDLAVAARAAWLLSHDRELLRLAKDAGALGVHVTRPILWQPEPQPSVRSH